MTEDLQLLVTAISGPACHVVQRHRGFQLILVNQRQGIQIYRRLFQCLGFRGARQGQKLMIDSLLEAAHQPSTLNAQLAHGLEIALSLAIGFLLGQVKELVIGTIQHIAKVGSTERQVTRTHLLKRPRHAAWRCFSGNRL